MAPKRFQYAQLPVFQYQTFERRYQTFDRQTLEFSYHPVIPGTTGPLTPENDQDKVGLETQKGPDTNPPAIDESSTEPSSSADSSSPESDGKFPRNTPFLTIMTAINVESWQDCTDVE
jgi:hypothetical protein